MKSKLVEVDPPQTAQDARTLGVNEIVTTIWNRAEIAQVVTLVNVLSHSSRLLQIFSTIECW